MKKVTAFLLGFVCCLSAGVWAEEPNYVAFLDELAAAENCATLAVPSEFTDNFSVSGKAVYLTGIEEKDIRRVDCECHVLTKKSGILVGDVLSAIAEVKRLGGTTFNVSGQTMFKMHKNYKVPEDIEFPVNVNTDTSLFFNSQYCGDEEVVLDLNGHTLSQAIGIGGGYWYSRIHVDCATVRVIDSSEGKTGKVTGIGSCLTVTGYKDYTDDDYPEPTDLPGKLTIDAGLYTLTGGPTGSKTSGPYYAPNGLVAVFYAGELVINGGTFDAASELNLDGKCASVIGAGRSMNKPEWGMPSITINGGEFVAVPLDQLCDTRDPGVPQSEDGLFSGNATNADYVAINGGAFSVEPPKAMIAEGLEFKDGKVVAIEYTDGGDYTTNKKLSWALSQMKPLAGQHIKYTCGEGAAYLDVPELDADGNLDGVVKLTLNNATITNSSDSNAIFLGTGYQAEIKLVGENSITAPSKTAIYLSDDTTITGDGSLAIREASTGIFGGTGSSLTIKSGTIDISSAYSAGKGISINYGVKYTQNGGTVNIAMTGGSAFGFSGSSASGTNPSSKFILNGGELTVIDAKRTAMNLSDAEINGGMLTAKHSQYASTAVVSASTRFVVTGGNIVVSKPDKNGNDVVSAANLSVTGAKISGGSFNFEPTATWIETGYQLKSLEDGSYGVAPKNTLAVIGTTEYDTLAEAFSAASVNQTIKLSKALTINEELTTVAAFDLNERTLTGGTISAKSISNGALIGTTIDGETEILGGTFTDVTLGSDVVVKGGTFNSDVSANCAAGLTAFPNGDGTYSALPIVAKIGEKCFKSFEDAVESITDETMTTITLVADSSLKTVPYNITNKNLTLDLNGNALTHTEAGGYRMIYFTADNGNEHTIVVKDSSEAKTGRIEKIITNSIGAGMAYTIVADKGSTLKLESGTLKSSGGGVWIDNAKFEMTGGRIDGGASSGLMIQGGIAEKKAVKSVISGGEITGKIGIKTGSYIDLLIKGDAVITGTVSNDDSGSIVAGYDNHIAITSGSVVVNGNIKGVAAREGQEDGSVIELSAGTYNNITNLEMLEGYILPGYLAWEIGENSYVVSYPVAKIGETLYYTYADAVQAANKEITSVDDITTIKLLVTPTEANKFAVPAGMAVLVDWSEISTTLIHDNTLYTKSYDVQAVHRLGQETLGGKDNKPIDFVGDLQLLAKWGYKCRTKLGYKHYSNMFLYKDLKLTEDVEMANYVGVHSAININGEVLVDLNGHTLKHQGFGATGSDAHGPQDMAAFDVKSGGVLTVKDSSAAKTGMINANMQAISVREGGEFILEGGTITAQGAYYKNSPYISVCVDVSGKFTMKGGCVSWIGRNQLIGPEYDVLIVTRGTAKADIQGGTLEPIPYDMQITGNKSKSESRYYWPSPYNQANVPGIYRSYDTPNGENVTIANEVVIRRPLAKVGAYSTYKAYPKYVKGEYFYEWNEAVTASKAGFADGLTLFPIRHEDGTYNFTTEVVDAGFVEAEDIRVSDDMCTWKIGAIVVDAEGITKASRSSLSKAVEAAVSGDTVKPLETSVGNVTIPIGVTIAKNGQIVVDEFTSPENYVVVYNKVAETWTVAKVFVPGEGSIEAQVKPEDGETAAEMAPIKVTEAWVEANVEPVGETATVEEINKALNKQQENGNLAWQNYVLGIDPTKPLVADATHVDDVVEVTILDDATMPSDTGFTISYAIVHKNAAGDTNELDYLDIPLTKDEDADFDPTGIYQVKVIITHDDETKATVEIPTENKIGVVKAMQEMELAIVAVPWKQIAAEDSDITVDNLVHKEMLDIGDMIYVYKTDGGYNTWTLEADANGNKVWGTMQVVDARGARTSGHAGDHTVQRGAGVFLKRQDPSKPYYLCGQVDDSEVVETLPEKINLVANPNVTDFDLNTDGAIAAAEGDTIIVPTPAAPKKCTKKDGKWGYLEDYTDARGVVHQRRVNDVKIPAGTGFWYEKGDKSNSSKINWSK